MNYVVSANIGEYLEVNKDIKIGLIAGIIGFFLLVLPLLKIIEQIEKIESKRDFQGYSDLKYYNLIFKHPMNWD